MRRCVSTAVGAPLGLRAVASSAVTYEHFVAPASRGGAAYAVSTVDAMPDTLPRRVAMYMLSSSRAADAAPTDVAFVDNNTSAAVPHLMRALAAAGAAPEAVRYIIVTHVHLDHAAGTGVLLQHCPRATVLCHPRARRHLVDPAAVIAGARAVYPAETHDAIIGDMRPCDPDRVRAVGDGESVELGEGRPLRFLHTDGHARHHLVVHDPASDSLISGDSFGMTYDVIAAAGLPADTFLPSTSPVDFHCDDAVAAVRRIAAVPGLRRVYLAHYGGSTAIASGAAQLEAMLARHEAVRADASRQLQGGAPRAAVLAAAAASVAAAVRDHVAERCGPGTDVDAVVAEPSLQATININAQGLVVAAERRPVPL